jgi:putative heme-binding domain-containing protein
MLANVKVWLAYSFALAAVCAAQEARTPLRNPFEQDSKAAESGRLGFRIYCSGCHGLKGQGGRSGPDLTRGSYSAGDTDGALFQTIRDGVAGTAMPKFGDDFSADMTWQLVAYIRSMAHPDATPSVGDPASGEKLFWGKGACGQCHRVGNKGTSLGPDLTRAGRQRSVAYLRESVVTPNADITPGYETITVITRDGLKIVGVARGYDNFSAQLVDMAGKYYSFDKDSVRSISRDDKSLMPETYAGTFSAAELNDLLAYMTTLKGGVQ